MSLEFDFREANMRELLQINLHIS